MKPTDYILPVLACILGTYSLITFLRSYSIRNTGIRNTISSPLPVWNTTARQCQRKINMATVIGLPTLGYVAFWLSAHL